VVVVNDLLLYDEDDPPEPRRRPYDDLEDEHQECPTAAYRNPSMLLP
jgi:hypothetical protein